MKRFTPMVCAITLVTLAAAGVFAVTLVHAAIYEPDGPGVVILPYPPVADAGSDTVLVSSGSYGAAGSAASLGGAVAAGTASGAAAPLDPAEAAVLATYPDRLSIPSLGIDAHVQEVGVTARGSVGTPDNFTDVGWYVYGATPGQPGTAVIDGHVDNGLSLAGVFKHLADIQPGADVTVTTRGGARLVFRVDAITWYDYQNTPPDALFPKEPGTHLILVTCGGDWVSADRTYDKRLVVTATLVPSE